MPRGPVPAEFHGLLESQAFAFVATLGKDGAPQVTPVWFLWDGANVKLSLIDGMQRHLNLTRDDRIAVAIAHPAEPYRYLELRGRAVLEPDHDGTIFRAIARKYTGSDFSLEPPDTVRHVATVFVERHTFQAPVDLPPPSDRPR
jgi:PPOX class probable F420-dependent enzyme